MDCNNKTYKLDMEQKGQTEKHGLHDLIYEAKMQLVLPGVKLFAFKEEEADSAGSGEPTARGF